MAASTARPDRPVAVTRLLPPPVVAALVVGVLRRPGLWSAALGQLWSMRSPSWWRRPPFLPLPPADYARFRLQTMYGGPGPLPEADAPVAAEQILGWLAWAKRERAHQQLR